MITISLFLYHFFGITTVFPWYFYGNFSLIANKIGHLRQIPYIRDPHGVTVVSAII